MAKTVGSALVARYDNLYFSTTKTLRNETVNIAEVNANYVINVDGTIYENKPSTGQHATITLVGGYDTFVHSKSKETPKFYMTERQKVTIYNILNSLSKRIDTAEIAADNEILDLIVSATYRNFCG